MVAAWNGWLVDSLVQAAMVFERPDWLAWRRPRPPSWSGGVHWVDGRLRRASRDGVAGDAPGILEDYAALAQARRAAGRRHWRTRCGWTGPGRCSRCSLDQFDDAASGFFDTAADAEALYTRPQDPTDNATPRD